MLTGVNVCVHSFSFVSLLLSFHFGPRLLFCWNKKLKKKESSQIASLPHNCQQCAYDRLTADLQWMTDKKYIIICNIKHNTCRMKFHMQRLPRNFGWPISVFFCCPFAVNNFDVFFSILFLFVSLVISLLLQLNMCSFMIYQQIIMMRNYILIFFIRKKAYLNSSKHSSDLSILLFHRVNAWWYGKLIAHAKYRCRTNIPNTILIVVSIFILTIEKNTFLSPNHAH